MSNVEVFTNEAIPGIKNEVIVMTGFKQTLLKSMLRHEKVQPSLGS